MIAIADIIMEVEAGFCMANLLHLNCHGIKCHIISYVPWAQSLKVVLTLLFLNLSSQLGLK